MEAQDFEDLKGEVTILTRDMTKIAAYVEQGVWYRKLVIGTALSLVLSIGGTIYTMMKISYGTGQYIQKITDVVSTVSTVLAQVSRNSERLTGHEVELKHVVLEMEKMRQEMGKYGGR